MLEKNEDILWSQQAIIILEICRLFWNCYLADSMNNSYGESLGHATDISLAEFCMEIHNDNSILILFSG